MGVLNVTPDSFSDGGDFFGVDRALRRAERMVEEGADILDIGGESTQPGAAPVSGPEEIERVVPVIEALGPRVSVPISIDTSKPEVMRAAVNAGAGMINDVRALRGPGALEVAVEAGVPVCLMHMQGEPRTMQAAPVYRDVVSEVRDFLRRRIQVCVGAGMDPERVLVDPGFGFGKTLAHNLALLAGLGELCSLGPPVLVGLSRKSMIGTLTGRSVTERLAGSLAAAVLAVERGVRLVRVHDVTATVDALRVVRAVRDFGSPAPQSEFSI
ncbi:dihydropteroate synthase [Candidatus Thiosymbion oneisti]|uniref:dihydropteroate synthase n=1 Tax=Candidatus Thiosymbion oneisti TaxID=589554 RepID=UPI00105E7332|nr:dihydropteroate synthase [Candidatus Thiosymbion oneisti]